MKKLLLAYAALAAVGPFADVLSSASGPDPVVETDVRLRPESERVMRRLIVGLDPNQTKYFMLPETTTWDARSPDPHVRYLRRQLYWLNFEMLHGGILKAAPEYTRFYVAVPDSRIVLESMGNEEDVFREYLRLRVGWSPAEIARRVRFFKTPVVIAFPRDMAEPLGTDGRDRLVLAIGADSDASYAEPLRRLVSSFPDDFVLKVLPEINTEGGDLSLVRLPEGGVGVLVGYHRILRFLATKSGGPVNGRKIESAEVEEGRSAFRRAFYGLEVLIVGEEGLRDPRMVSDELFHADMVVNVLRGRSGVTAFVPSYQAPVVDAITQSPLAEAVLKRAQAEYDRVAEDLRRRGYRIVRLPLRDHPSRTPVQVGDFVDLRTGRQSLLLGKYPFHLRLPDGRNPQRDLQAALAALEAVVESWRHAPSEERWRDVSASLAATWTQMDVAAASPNPAFDAQARIYESEGIRVIPVPIYPTGEGGIHCLLLN